MFPYAKTSAILVNVTCSLMSYRLLDYAVDDDKVRKQDSYIAVGAVAGNTLGGFLAWDWVRANWESLAEK